MQVASNRMKVLVDKHHRDVTFDEDDYVYLCLQPYRQVTVTNRSSQKLAPRFFGPFKILARVGPVAYRLELPPDSQCNAPNFLNYEKYILFIVHLENNGSN
ncbi:hypothetical protein ACOSQ4_022197 [Xanthoceras sorbifolium]